MNGTQIANAAPQTPNGFVEDGQFYPVSQPVQPIKIGACPHCHEHGSQGSNTIRYLRAGLIQLLAAVLVIVFSILRLVRLVIAAVLTLLAIAGTGFYRASQFIVHPDDRRLLPSVPRRRD